MDKPLLAALVCAAIATRAAPARAQACCAGAGIATPGRLALHDFVLAGTELRAGALVGSFDQNGNYSGRAPGTVEDDLEEDLFAAVRVLKRGQVALLVPFVETLRRAGSVTDAGGGIGDVNLSARWDFLYAGQSRYVPGIAVLAGVTFPSGVPIESASDPLGSDATGIGAYQINGGLALEQTFGPWLVALSCIVAARTPRTVGNVSETLAPQVSTLATLAYVTRREIAFALSSSFTYEGDATIDGATAADTRRLTLALTGGVLFPIGDAWRAQVGVTWNPPIVGENTLATAGLQWTLVHAWF